MERKSSYPPSPSGQANSPESLPSGVSPIGSLTDRYVQEVSRLRAERASKTPTPGNPAGSIDTHGHIEPGQGRSSPLDAGSEDVRRRADVEAPTPGPTSGATSRGGRSGADVRDKHRGWRPPGRTRPSSGREPGRDELEYGTFVKCKNGTRRPAAMLSLGWRTVSHAITYVHTLTPGERWTWRIVQDFARSGDGLTFRPSQSLIAMQTRRNRETVNLHLARLEEIGVFVEVERHDGRVTRYVLSPTHSEGTFESAAATRRGLDALTLKHNGHPAATAPLFLEGEVSLDRFGFDIIPLVLEYHEDLDARDIEVLGIFWGYRRLGKCKAYLGGLDYLSELTGEEVRNVRRRLSRLKRLGLVRSIPRGARVTTIYLPVEMMTDAVWARCRETWKRVEPGGRQGKLWVHMEVPLGGRNPTGGGVEIRHPTRELIGEYISGQTYDVRADARERSTAADDNGRGRERGPAQRPINRYEINRAGRTMTTEAEARDVLRRTGMKWTVIEKLLQGRGLAALKEAMRTLPTASRQRDKKDNPAGWLIDWLRNGRRPKPRGKR